MFRRPPGTRFRARVGGGWRIPGAMAHEVSKASGVVGSGEQGVRTILRPTRECTRGAMMHEGGGRARSDANRRPLRRTPVADDDVGERQTMDATEVLRDDVSKDGSRLRSRCPAGSSGRQAAARVVSSNRRLADILSTRRQRWTNNPASRVRHDIVFDFRDPVACHALGSLVASSVGCSSDPSNGQCDRRERRHWRRAEQWRRE